MRGAFGHCLRLVWIVAIVAAAVGCQRGGTLLDWFTSAMNDPGFQGEGPVTGSIEMTSRTTSVSGTLTGHFKMSGGNTATSMAIVIGSYTTTSESADLGEWSYSRKDEGPWTRSARKTNDSFPTIEALGGLVDKGIENHYGRALHRFEPRDMSAVPAEDFLGLDIEGGSDFDFGLTLWSEDDGTPAGMTFDLTYKQKTGDVTADCHFVIDIAFENHSGVTIDIPEGAAEPSTEAYPQAAGLRDKIAALQTVQGRVYGTYTAGSKSLSLNGSMRINSGNTEIHIHAGAYSDVTWSEIVAGGNRYVSRDDKIWVGRGKKDTPMLPALLAAAVTDRDAGVQAVGGRPLHCIISPANSLDVASAFGIDMVNVSGPGTGSGSGRTTPEIRPGLAERCSGARASTASRRASRWRSTSCSSRRMARRSPPPRTRGSGSWTRRRACAFGLPVQFKRTSDKNVAAYADTKAGAVFGYIVGSSGKDNAASIATQLVTSFGAVIATKYDTIVDGQTGESMLGQTYTWEFLDAREQTQRHRIHHRGRRAQGFQCRRLHLRGICHRQEEQRDPERSDLRDRPVPALTPAGGGRRAAGDGRRATLRVQPDAAVGLAAAGA